MCLMYEATGEECYKAAAQSSELYLSSAIKILKAMEERFCDFTDD